MTHRILQGIVFIASLRPAPRRAINAMIHAMVCAVMVLLVAICITPSAHAQSSERSFHAEGSDTVFGLGARHLAMGGTGTATANGAYGVYWNPAALAEVERPTATISRQINATLRPYSYLAYAQPLSWFERGGVDAGIGLARYPRVHAHSTGAFAEGDPQSIFLRLLLPGITGTYDGEIDSKTMVNRLAIGISPRGSDWFSLGAHIDYIDCKTRTCGLHASSNGYEARSVHATAWSYGFSGRLNLSKRLSFGASMGDINTVLDVDVEVTDDTGTQAHTWQAQLPAYLRAELAWQASDRLLLAFGYQSFQGTYGANEMKFETLHLGAELKHGKYISSRFGIWAPITIQAENIAEIELPVPFVPSIGVGYERDGFAADFALYVHPMMSYHQDAPSPAFELSLRYRF